MSGQDSTPRAVVYHRVARDTPETPDGQLEAIQQYAEACGYETVAPYEDDAGKFGLIITDAEPVTEHAQMMSGGGYHVRNGDPEIEDIYPLAQWIVHGQRFGGHVYRRRVIVLEDWTEITGEQPSAKEYAATHPIVCAHADEDGQGSHILAPGEKCNRRKP